MERLNIKRDIENVLKQIKTPKFKKEIEDYLLIRERIDKVSIRTRRSDTHGLFALYKFLISKKLDYSKLTQDQMLEAEKYFETKLNLSTVSIQLYEIHIKRFYKYLSNKTEYKKGKRFQKNISYPRCVSWIGTLPKNGTKLPIDKLLDFKGLKRMLDVCDNLRDQAMTVTFADAGLRNSELISLNIENVGFDELGAFFILPQNKTSDLKTGQRKVRMFLVPSGSKYIKDFVNNHPFKNYDKAPLFYSREAKHYYNLLKKANNGNLKNEELELLRLHRLSVKDIIKKIGNLANVPIKKPHDLRHNSCTWCAKAGLNEMELRIRYGWQPTSKMPSKYTHLASKDIDDKIKIITGFKTPEKPESDLLQPIICWNCNEDNVPTAKFCNRCGANLSPKKEELTPTAIDTGITTQEMLKDPEFKEFYKDMLAITWEKYKEMKEKQK